MTLGSSRLSSARLWLPGLGHPLDQPFHLAHREPLRTGLLGHLPLQFLGREAQNGARVPHGQAVLRQQLLHVAGQAQQPQSVGDGAAVLAGAAGDLLVAEAQILDQALEGLRHFDGGQILTLDVLDQRDFEELLVGKLLNDDRNLGPGRPASRPASAALRPPTGSGPPRLRTTSGWITPLTLMDCASSCSRSA